MVVNVISATVLNFFMSVKTLFVYVDETVYRDKVWGAGALVTEEAVSEMLVHEALTSLGNDPDIHDPRWKVQDHRTLDRGFFHATDDSQNAHSHFAKVIKRSMNGLFVFSYKSSIQSASEAETHWFNSLLTLISIDKRGLKFEICLENREGLNREALSKIISRKHKISDDLAYEIPSLPSFYSYIDINSVVKKEPGVQVADFLLWSTNLDLYESENTKKLFGLSGLD
jgi:hypothetical protein